MHMQHRSGMESRLVQGLVRTAPTPTCTLPSASPRVQGLVMDHG